MPKTTAQCRYCNKKLGDRRTHAKWCSQKCRQLHRSRLDCAVCGKRIVQGRTSRPQGEATCRECQRVHGSAGFYRKGCRCDECRQGHAKRMKAYSSKFRDEHGVLPSTMYRRRNFEATGKWHRRGGDFVSEDVRLEIYDRDRWICQICFSPVDPLAEEFGMKASLDHKIPQSAQLLPDHSPENLQTAHVACNARKGARIGFSMTK